MSHTIETKNVPIKMWTDPTGVEPQAMQQLRNIAALPWAFHHVAVMPDVHYGKGATVGSVVAMKDAISPAAVGVDIGCGMAAVKTSLTASMLPDNLSPLRGAIEAAIPVGFNQHQHPVAQGNAVDELMDEYPQLDGYVQNDQIALKALRQLGTLGGGNHFVELCLDTEQSVWMMLHSGSRNIGKTLADVHISRARSLAHNAELPDPDLAVFLAGTPGMASYRRDLFWAQRYAALNRHVMLDIYKDVLAKAFPGFAVFQGVQCHHNYVSEEEHFGEKLLVTRKGAINAGAGVYGIIPGSMGTKSYIVRGLGNPESYNSASHGAGRRMSRGAANRTYTVADLAEQTTGVECRKDEGVVDEIPGAYKQIEEVMANQRDLVEIVAELKQVLCVKG